MPVRRRRFVRKRRPLRRRRRVRVPRNRFRTRTFGCRQTVELPNFVILAGTNNFYSYTFQFSDLSQSNNWGSVFDSFRINAVKVTFYPQITQYNNTTPGTACPEFYSVVDYDSATVPSSINTLVQYQNCKRSWFNRPHSRYLKPRAAGACYLSTSTTGYYLMPRGVWFNNAYAQIPHYGLLVGIALSNASLMAGQTIRVTAKYYVQLKNVH